MKVKKEEIKQWINDVYTKLWALLSLYGETDGFKIVPEGEAEENPQDFISRKIGEIRRIENNFSLYMDEQEIAEVKKLKPRLIAIDLETATMAIDPEVGEILDKLNKIINDTVYFCNRHFNQHAVPGMPPDVVFQWGINPNLIYFDRVFDLMEKYPETYMEITSHYPGPELVTERNAYFEKIKERNERENLKLVKREVLSGGIVEYAEIIV